MKLRPTSLFGRMLGMSLVATLVALVVAGFAIGGVLERFVIGGVDGRLGDRLVALESAVRADGTLDPTQLARVTGRIAPNEPWRIELPGDTFGSSGDAALAETLRRRHPPRAPGPPGALPAREGTPFEGRTLGEERVHGLIATIATPAGQVRIAAAVPRGEIDRPVVAALAPLAASLAMLGLALGGAALVQVRLGLRPLQALRRAVEEIRHGRATRVPEDVPDELAPLARELNALAADNASALATARQSAANLAHALKTPVATLGLHLAGDARAQAQLARMNATLRHHLGRARAAAIDRRGQAALAPALSDLAGTVAAIHAGRVLIRLDVPEGLAAAIDAQDLDELAGNLIDNAARHAVTTVVVSAFAAERRVVLTVADDGPGIPAADRERATTPGARLDERSEGHGFGLSIARELASLYGGTLELDEAPGGGLLARVSLPAAGQAARSG